jgi:hypothetical protein
VIESQSHRSRKLRRLSRSLDPSRLKNTSEATKSCGGTTAAHPAKSMPDHRTRNVGSSMATPDDSLRRNDEVGDHADRQQDQPLSGRTHTVVRLRDFKSFSLCFALINAARALLVPVTNLIRAAEPNTPGHSSVNV